MRYVLSKLDLLFRLPLTHSIAPERLSQEQEGKAVDMWSIGCIMYFMLFGVPPFYSEKDDDEENEDEIFDSVLEGAVQFPEGKSISDLGNAL